MQKVGTGSPGATPRGAARVGLAQLGGRTFSRGAPQGSPLRRHLAQKEHLEKKERTSSPAATTMTPFLLLPLLAASGTLGQIEVIRYVPRVADKDLEGKLTATTFALEPPNCVFDTFVSASDEIWLAVSFVNATASFKNPSSSKEIPPYEALFSQYSYMTMKATLASYPCKKDQPGNVLRIGNESSCKNDDTQTSCNGPLPGAGPYRVKFLAMGAKGPKAETRWSIPITLKKAELWKSLDTWPGRRSGDMIVITVILSALCGVVTIAFLSTVCYECFKRLRQGPPEEQQEQRPDPEPFHSSRYDTHHIPPAPPVPPPPPSAGEGPSPHLVSTSP